MENNELRAALAALKEELVTEVQDRILLAAAFTLKAEMIDRIFNRGLASDGAKIGDYSTTPAYFAKADFVRKSAFEKRGKTNTGDFKNGKARRSMYLPTGYKEFREIQGRKVDTKNFKMTGSLEKSINVLRDGDQTVIGITDGKESAKRHGLEEQVGRPVFPPSDADFETFTEAVFDEIEAIFNRNL